MENDGKGLTLVTGGAGFLGHHLVEALVAEGTPVRSLDVAQHKNVPEGVDTIEASILDDDALSRAMEGVTTVFHTAANAHLWAPRKSDFDTINHQGTRKAVVAAQTAGASRFIHVSSLTVLIGKYMGRAPVKVTEEERLGPDDMLGPYPLSKFLGERAALEANSEAFSVVSVLPTLPIGAGDRGLTGPTRMIIDLVNGRIPAYLDCVHNFIHVRDVAGGLIAARDRGTPGTRYLLGHENVTMRELLERLHEMTGVRMPSARAPYPVALMAGYMAEWIANVMTRRAPQAPLTGVRLAGRRVYFDNTRAREELGLSPRPLEEALRECLLWARKEGHIFRSMPSLQE